MHAIVNQDGDLWKVQHGNHITVKSRLTFEEACALCSYLNGGLPPPAVMVEYVKRLEEITSSE